MDEIPQVVLNGSVKEQCDKDPALAESIRRFSADARQALQWVKDGRYKTFEDAMEALTGIRPELVGEAPDIDDEWIESLELVEVTERDN